jgi:ribonuclease R
MNDLINAIDQVIEENDLPHEWSKEIVAELKELKHKKESKERVDLRSHPFVTIDGKDAKDFDDAVYCEKDTDGFILQVAIADVADIVKSGSEIDKEAVKRGTSIYFPKKVIPMLPEKISNDLCSLVPKKDRNVLV